MYSEKILKHFHNPKNQGSMKNANSIGQEGNPVCGDIMKIYLKINQRKNKNNKTEDFIEDVKFETLGCAVAIAMTSILSEKILNKSLKEAKKITKEELLESAGEMPPVKKHCSLLAIDALKKAIENFKS